MKVWQKVVLLSLTILAIALLIHWWMSYDEMKIIIKNERNESININIAVTKMDDTEIFNKSFLLEANESVECGNITTWAGNYYVEVMMKNDTNQSVKEKIKYGKYYETIEVIIGEKIQIKNERN